MPVYWPEHNWFITAVLILNTLHLGWTIILIVEAGEFVVNGATVEWYFSED
jgi:hypothetical protein